MMLNRKIYATDKKIDISTVVVRDTMECFKKILLNRNEDVRGLIYDFEFNRMVRKVTEYITKEPRYKSHKAEISYKFIEDVIDIIFCFNMYEQFNEDIKIVPVSREEFYRKGIAYLHFGYLKNGLECLTRVINYIGKVEEEIISNSYFLRANCLLKLGKTEDALRDVNTAYYLEPENIDYLFLKINIEIKLRKKCVRTSIKKAISLLQRMRKALAKEKTGIFKNYNFLEFKVMIGLKTETIIISPLFIDDKVSELKKLFKKRNIAGIRRLLS